MIADALSFSVSYCDSGDRAAVSFRRSTNVFPNPLNPFNMTSPIVILFFLLATIGVIVLLAIKLYKWSEAAGKNPALTLIAFVLVLILTLMSIGGIVFIMKSL